MDAQVVEIQKRIEDVADWRGRRRAALELGWTKPAAALDLLLQLLRDPVHDVRQAAVVSLGRLGDARALRELAAHRIRSAQHPAMRLAAVVAIAELGDVEVLPWLARGLDDQNWMVRVRAEEAFAEKLASVGRAVDEETVQALIRLLDIEHKEARKRIIATISRLGSLDNDQVFDALKGGSPRIQTGLIEVLGNIGYAGFTPVLLDFLRQGSHFHQIASARALAKIRSINSVEGLVQAFDTHHAEVAKEVGAALIQIGEPCVDVLLETLRHTHKKHVQVHIVRCLGRLRSVRAIPALIDALSNSYSLIREFAIEALSSFAPEDVLDSLVEVAVFKDLPIDGLLSALKQETNPLREIRAIRALGELGSHRAVPILKDALDTCAHPQGHREIERALTKIACNAWSRAGAVRVLENLGDTRAVDTILALVRDDSHYVRTTALIALRRFRDERIIPTLLATAREDPLHVVRGRAIATLGLLWTDQESILLTAIDVARDEPNFDVRAEAIRVLGRYMDRRSLPILLERLGDPRWTVREASAFALGNFGAAVIPELSALLHATDQDVVRRRIVQILVRIGNAAALQLLDSIAGMAEASPQVLADAKSGSGVVRRRLGIAPSG